MRERLPKNDWLRIKCRVCGLVRRVLVQLQRTNMGSYHECIHCKGNHVDARWGSLEYDHSEDEFYFVSEDHQKEKLS